MFILIPCMEYDIHHGSRDVRSLGAALLASPNRPMCTPSSTASTYSSPHPRIFMIHHQPLLLSVSCRRCPVSNSSQETYNSVCEVILRRYPEDMLKYDQIKRCVALLSGITPHS